MKRMRSGLAFLLILAMALSMAGCEMLMPKHEYHFSGTTEESALGGPYKFYFRELGDREKMAYNAILADIESFPERIEVPTLNETQLERVYTALLYDNPKLFFLKSNSVIRQTKQKAYFVPQYVMDSEDYNATMRKCDATAKDIAKEARTHMDDFGQELVVHDRLISLCTYSDDDNDPYKSSIYGVLCGGSAACEGYSKAAKYLFDMLGIPSMVICGKSTPPGASSQSHMWNIVQIHDAYYHLDLTWDDPVLENGGQVLRYDYFNVTDEKISKTHKEYESAFACTETADNYYIHEDLLLHDITSGEDKVRAIENAVQTIEKGSAGFQLCFADDRAYNQAKESLFKKEGVYELLRQIEANTDISFAIDRVSYACTDSSRMIDIILEAQ